ncbi:hypothetical protein E1263_00195 [Kribbella antibiotica]|uniref:Amino acid permease/ SLC12A domain-containing protein n=1 Tax=Kribbella antibiotica TaxID=190195 RepID=A0A4R4ZW02_9ACTN|nr:hypothetical protein [Kribbella antibiotica]TDD63408.1 hypothetical protein E1263_00195 [Kribbella antibiotica]
MVDAGNDLSAGLNSRHVTMVSIAGVIGAGLFVGSGTAISKAGPGVLIAYAFAGTLVVLVAVASCLNSALYTASRMIYSFGKRGAPNVRTIGGRVSDSSDVCRGWGVLPVDSGA